MNELFLWLVLQYMKIEEYLVPWLELFIIDKIAIMRGDYR